MFSCSSSISDSSGDVQGGRNTFMSRGLSRSVIGALGGVGMRSGVPSLSAGSSMKTVMDGNGRIVPGLSLSLWGSKVAGDANTGACADAGAATGAG